MRMPGWRAFAVFWVLVAAVLAGGAGTLAWLGPPPEEPAAAQAAPPAVAQSPDAPPEPPAAAEPEAEAEAGAPSLAATPEPDAAPAPVPGPVAEAAAPRVAAAPDPLPSAAAPQPAHLPPPPAPPPAPPAAPAPPPLVPAEPRRPAVAPVLLGPDSRLLEATRHGPVPRMGPEGRSSIRAYSRPFDREDRRPRVAIVVNNIGLFAQHSEEAIRRLPGAVALAISPYALRPEPLLEQARRRGMEMLSALPLEPQGFGHQADPGDRALLTGLSVSDNLDRLDWVLSRIQGQVGAIGALGGMRGERFAANPELLGIVQATLTRRGLLYIDPRPGAPQPERAFGRTVDILLDEPSAVRSEVERRLAELEALARQNGSALGLASDPAPSVVAAIAAWSTGLDQRGVVIAPVSVLIRRPAEQISR